MSSAFPDGITLSLRLTLLFSILFAVMSSDPDGPDSDRIYWRPRRPAPTPPFTWWLLYLLTSFFLCLTYLPELDGWYETYWPGLLAVLILRLAAGLEAIHYQTIGYPYWSRATGGILLLSTAAVAGVWYVKDGEPWAVVIQLRRYGNLWIGLVLLTSHLFLWLTDRWGCRRTVDCHALIVSVSVWLQMAVSVAYLSGEHSGTTWLWVDRIATGMTAATYFAWGLWRVVAEGNGEGVGTGRGGRTLPVVGGQ